MVKYVVEKGFDGNIKNKNGSTALHFGKMTRFDHFYLLINCILYSFNYWTSGYCEIFNRKRI